MQPVRAMVHLDPHPGSPWIEDAVREAVPRLLDPPAIPSQDNGAVAQSEGFNQLSNAVAVCWLVEDATSADVQSFQELENQRARSPRVGSRCDTLPQISVLAHVDRVEGDRELRPSHVQPERPRDERR